MKTIQKILMLLVIVFALTACGKAKETVEETDREEREEKEEENTSVVDTERYKAYIEVLEDVIEDDEWPDGTSVRKGESAQYNEYDFFAICNVDLDEEVELIVEITSTSMAGMELRVYDYDEEEDEVVLQVQEFPAVVFYDNGVMGVAAPRNHTNSDVWPTSYYQHDAKTDEYIIFIRFSLTFFNSSILYLLEQ
jgi:predicted small lipoprotein YifL